MKFFRILFCLSALFCSDAFAGSNDEEVKELGQYFCGIAICIVYGTPFLFVSPEDKAGEFDEYPYSYCDGFYTDDDSKNWGGRAYCGYSFDSEDTHAVNYFSEINLKGLGADFLLSKFENDATESEWDVLSINVFYNFLRTEKLNFKSGLGYKEIRHEDDSSGNNLNYFYGFEYFPVKPLHVNVRFEYTRINGEDIVLLSPEIGVVLNRFEISGAYTCNRLDEETFKSVDVRVSVWF